MFLRTRAINVRAKEKSHGKFYSRKMQTNPRLDVVHKWLEFRKTSQNKLLADYDFVKLYNTSNSHLFEILGKISRGSLHRWYGMIIKTKLFNIYIKMYFNSCFWLHKI